MDDKARATKPAVHFTVDKCLLTIARHPSRCAQSVSSKALTNGTEFAVVAYKKTRKAKRSKQKDPARPKSLPGASGGSGGMRKTH